MKKLNILKVLGAITLLIVLSFFLAACDNGYHASVRSIWFSKDKDGIAISDEELITINSAKDTGLYVFCDTPSSIKEISLTFAYDRGKLDIPDIDYDEDWSEDGTYVTRRVDTGLLPMLIMVKAQKGVSITDPVEITVTVEPGRKNENTASCKVKTN